MELPERLATMLSGAEGLTRQKAARLVIDLANTAGAEGFIEVNHSHVSGVSVITGGHGLRRFLADLAGEGSVAIPTTLNSAGCDKRKMEEMDIDYPDFLQQQFEIITAYEQLGIESTLSCTPYDRGIEGESGIASWAESNAVAFSNSWTDLVTNRESGLSALATALTGYAPKWGLHLEENRVPNIVVDVECDLSSLADWSILGDWIGKQVRPGWDVPYGPMPLIRGLPSYISFASKKALTAAAANYGCAMLWAEGHTKAPTLTGKEETLVFTEQDLAARYEDLAPKGQVDLVVIGCPQASLEEIRITAAAVRSHSEMGQLIPDERLWVFTSRHNYQLAEADGSIGILEEAGAVILQDTCPEVTPYNRNHYNHLMTNSLKAEHYLTSGLNKMPTSVGTIQDCIAHAFNPGLSEGEVTQLQPKAQPQHASAKTHQSGGCSITGGGLESQGDWEVEGRAMVTDVAITYLGYVNRDSGVIEEVGHPLDGQSIEDTILIYPKGSGSTVAPYVLMGLIYTGKGPRAIVNRDVCSLTLPACSLLDLPYSHGFEEDPCLAINDGDMVRVSKVGDKVTVQVLERVGE
ncbi:MAG: aconitase X [Candidatus Poseidoniaceae archaeon]|nr:aconitase X [Candidatus Poseidoniaceae archaeon]|tara:strand:- start:400 stop:2133 length:1734 start_codon:yes stop_codon:yes gene_type:complete